jgi:histidyl-tRNA synthetase
VSVERRPVERVRGTQDSWAIEAQQMAAIRRQLEDSFTSFGYSRIEVPVLEPAELHLRKSGLEIISKLYAFEDQGGRQLCLRPELTASVVRAFVAQPPARLPVRLFSTGPVFRYERPSKGRYRQFTQSGVELIGAEGAVADAEVVFLAMHALDQLGLRAYSVTLGHVGILGQLLAKLGMSGRLRTFFVENLEEARRRGVAAVRRRLEDLDPELFEEHAPPFDGLTPQAGAASTVSPHSGSETEPGRGVSANGSATASEQQVSTVVSGLLAAMGGEALGRRSEAEVVERLIWKRRPSAGRATVEGAFTFMQRLAAIRGAPVEALANGRDLLAEYKLDDAPLRALQHTVDLLGEFGADLGRVEVDLGLGRGLQYYTGTVFEIDHGGLGSESQLCGGGRYDDLSRSLGARQALPALGFAFGVERIRLALESEGVTDEAVAPADVMVVAASPEQIAYAAQVAQRVRQTGLRAQLDVAGRPLRSALAFADREGFRQVVIVGEAEQRTGTLRIRDMAGGGERALNLADLDQLGASQP